MKPTHRNPLLRNFVLSATISLCLGQASNAAALYWDGTATGSWGTATSWSTSSSATTPDPAAEPGASDDAIFNISTANLAQVTTLNGNKNAFSLTFNNAGTSLIRSDSGTTRTLNLGSGGITANTGAGAVTIGTGSNGNVVSLFGSQVWTNNSSNTVNIYNTIGRSNGSVVSLTGTGAFTASIHALANSLIGTWASTGSGTSLRYLTKNGSNVMGAYTAGTAASDASFLTSVAGTFNYDLADAIGSAPAAFSANSIRFTGAAGTLSPGSSSFVIRGLMNSGTGKWTIGTNALTIGSTNELVIIANSQETEISSPILNNGSTASSVSYHGAGTLTLSGDNTFTNGLNIGAGKVVVNHLGALNSSSPNVVNFNGISGTLSLNGNSLSLPGLNSTSSGLILQPYQIVENANATAANLSIGGSTASSTFYGIVRDGSGGGSLGITKVGTGTFTLGNANSYSGTTQVNAGILSVNLPTSLPDYTSAAKVILNGGTLSVRTGNGTSTGWSFSQIDSLLANATKTSGSLGIDTSNGSTTQSIAFTPTNLSSLGLTKLGNNALTLNLANSYNGATNVSNGVLTIQNAGALGTTAGATTVSTNGRLELEGGITVSGEKLTISGAGGTGFFNGALNSKSGINRWAGDITIGSNDTRIGAQAGSSIEISGIIDSGANNHLVTFRPADTTATVIISGANTYVGPTALVGGLVTVSSINSVVGGTASSNLGAPTAGNGTINFGAAEGSGLRYNGTGETTDRIINLNGTTQGGRIDQSGTGALRFTSGVTATGVGSKTLTLQGSTTGTGEIGGAIVDNSSTNTTSLSKAGSGTWTLSGTNTYTGTTTVSSGVLKLNYNTGAGGTDDSKLSDSAALTLSGSTLELAGGTHSEVVASTTLTAATFSKITRSSGSAALQMNAITRNAGASIDFSASGVATTDNTNSPTGILGTWATVGGSDWATNSTNLADGTITAFSAYVDLSDSSVISDGSTTNVRINSYGGGGSMTLGSAITTINTLLQSNISQPAIISLQSTNTLATSAIMVGTNAKGLTVGTAAEDGFLTAATPGGDLLLRNNSLTELLTINSVIANNTSASTLTKAGLGTVVLAGTNTYTGLTSVTEGSLKAGSATAFNNTSSLSVSPGATFDLNGYDAKFVTMTNNTGTVTTTAPGSGTDTFTLSAYNVDGIGNLFADNGTRALKVEMTSATGAARLATTNVNNTYSGGLVLGDLVRAAVPAGTVGTPGAITSGAFGRGTVTINGGNTDATGAQIWFSTANRTLVNDVIVNGNAGNGSRSGSFRVQSNGAAITGKITASAVDAWFGCDGAAGTILTLNGQLTGPSGFRFYQSNGTNTWTAVLNNLTANPNDYSGPTTINSAETTLSGASNQIPNGTDAGNVVLTSGTLNLAGFDETINGLTGAGTLDNVANTANGTANTLTLGDGNATGTFTGAIKNTTGTLSVAKKGTGTQTLSGVNTYAGTTKVDGGTLALGAAGSIATSPTVSIAAAAKFETVLLTNYVMPASQTFALELNGAGSGSSGQLNAAGLNISAGKVTFQISGTLDDAAYVLATYTSKTGTAFSSVTPVAGYILDYAYNSGTQIALVRSSPYDTWISAYPGIASLPADDPDKDGLVNQQEFAFGLDPSSGASVNPIIQQLNATTGQFTYQRRAATGLTYTVWTSTDLQFWSQDTAAVQTPSTIGSNESVEVTLSAAKPLTSSKLFVRIQAN